MSPERVHVGKGPGKGWPALVHEKSGLIPWIPVKGRHRSREEKGIKSAGRRDFRAETRGERKAGEF